MLDNTNTLKEWLLNSFKTNGLSIHQDNNAYTLLEQLTARHKHFHQALEKMVEHDITYYELEENRDGKIGIKPHTLETPLREIEKDGYDVIEIDLYFDDLSILYNLKEDKVYYYGFATIENEWEPEKDLDCFTHNIIWLYNLHLSIYEKYVDGEFEDPYPVEKIIEKI